MKKLNLSLILAFVAIFFITTNLSAKLTVRFIENPQIGDPVTIAQKFQEELDTLNIGDQTKLAKGFGNANAYANQAASFISYQGYDTWAIMLGLALGAQLPTEKIVSEFQKIPDKIQEEKDVYAGIGLGTAFNIGLNTGNLFGLKLLGRDIYLNLKVMYLPMPEMFGVKSKFMTFGVGANWQLMKSRSFGKGAVLWRGFSFGIGFIFNSNDIEYTLDVLDDIEVEDGGVTYSVAPEATLGIKSQTYSIPFELSSSLRLAWFLNLSIGMGFDLNFGKTDIKINTINDVTATPSIGPSVDGGRLEIDASTTGVAPSVARYRILVGVGIDIAPFVLAQVDMTYYVKSGLGVAISMGFVW